MHLFLLWLQKPWPHHHVSTGKYIPKTKKHGFSLDVQPISHSPDSNIQKLPTALRIKSILPNPASKSPWSGLTQCLLPQFYHLSPTPASWSLPYSIFLWGPDNSIAWLLSHPSSLSFSLHEKIFLKPQDPTHMPVTSLKNSTPPSLFLPLVPPFPLCSTC